MEFGKVAPEQLGTIDFSLPPDPDVTVHTLQEAGTTSHPRVYVGCAKWGRKEWVGKIYPTGTKPADYLQHYARQFNCIELNAIFYKLPEPEMMQNWAEKTGEGFLFCPKFSEVITHRLRLKNAERETAYFYQGIQAFGDKLGPSFLQLHENFSFQHFPDLENYLHSLPTGVNQVFLELRNKLWLSDATAWERTLHLLRETGTGLVITDASGRRDCVHMSLPIPRAFVRFVGNNLHPTDYTRINDWVERIRQWLDKGIQEVYFFMHQHEEKDSPELCLYLIERLNKVCQLNIKPPVYLQETLF